MKKILILLVALFLVSSFVVAEGQQGEPEAATTGAPEGAGEGAGAPEGAGEGQGEGEPMLIMEQEQEQKQLKDGTGEQQREQNKEKLQTGLENALGQITNENARERLQHNVNNFQLMYENRMQNMEGVEITEVNEETGALKIKAKEQVKFFGFINGKATQKFEMDKDGNTVEKKPWYRFMYKEMPIEEE